MNGLWQQRPLLNERAVRCSLDKSTKRLSGFQVSIRKNGFRGEVEKGGFCPKNWQKKRVVDILKIEKRKGFQGMISCLERCRCMLCCDWSVEIASLTACFYVATYMTLWHWKRYMTPQNECFRTWSIGVIPAFICWLLLIRWYISYCQSSPF